jgi:hypothetical protein
VALARGGSEIVEARDLLRAQLDAVGCGVLLDSRNRLVRGRGDVVALREQPGQSDLRRCGAGLGRDCRDLVDDAEVLFEVALGEAGGCSCAQSSSARSLGERIVPVRKPCPSGE